jgi:hypothetical protein
VSPTPSGCSIVETLCDVTNVQAGVDRLDPEAAVWARVVIASWVFMTMVCLLSVGPLDLFFLRRF